MENNQQKKEKLVNYLKFICRKQASKEPEEINVDFVDTTVELVHKLEGKGVALSSEEIEERVSRIPFLKGGKAQSDSKRSKKKINKRKLFLIAAVVSVLAVVLSVMSLGQSFDDLHRVIREKYGSVFNAPVGVPLQYDDEVFVYHSGKCVYYLTPEEFFENEEYDVLLPGKLPEDIMLKDIIVSDDPLGMSYEVIVSFNKSIISFHIDFDKSVSPVFKSNSEEVIEINGLQCYVDRLTDVNLVQIYFDHNGDTYVIAGIDEQNLLYIIENLQGRPENK